MKIDNMQPMTAQSSRFVSNGSTIQMNAQSQRDSGNSVAGELPSSGLTAAQSEQVVKQMNEAFKLNGNEVEFKLDQDAGKMVFYLKDAQSGETLRQIPDETVLRISKNIGQYLQDIKSGAGTKAAATLSGLLTDTKV